MSDRTQDEVADECWSMDGESYVYSSLGDLIDSNRDTLEVGSVVHIGDKNRPDPADFIGADDVVELLEARADDMCGEWAESWPSASREALAELDAGLDALITAWVAKHAPISFYSVNNSREYTITEDDLS